MGDKGGKKDKEKHQKQHDKRAQGKVQPPVDKGRPSEASLPVRQAKAG